MGNQIALFANPDMLIQKYFPGLSYSKTMSDTQYVISLMCLNEDEGQIIYKFFPDNSLFHNQPNFMEKMSGIIEKFDLRKHPNILVLKMDKIKDAENKPMLTADGKPMFYAYRQYVYNSLRERMLNKIPSLVLVEQKWFIFQILCAISQIHNEDVIHGDIKPDNFLVTSFNHVFLTDMVCYKPTFVKGDDLKRYNLYYGELENNQRCYFAPERFKEQDDEQMRSYSLLEKSMDIFSAGCVIAEILMDGNPLFDIEKLKKYGKGNYDPKPDLAKKIQDSKIVDIIMKMISIEPSKRPSIAVCIKMWNESTMPICFHKVLYQLTSSYVRPQYLFSDMKIALLRKYMPSIWQTQFDSKLTTLQIQKKLFEPLERTVFDLIREDDINNHNRILIPSCSLFEFIEQDSISPHKWDIMQQDKESASIIIQQIGTFIETCYFPQTKRCALEMLLLIGRESTLEIRLQQILPFVLKIFETGDDKPRQQSKVIAKAIEVAVMLFENLITCEKMHMLSNIDHQVFANYIMPQFSKMLKHHKDDQLIQITYTRYLPLLTKIGRKFTELSVKSRLAQKDNEENQEKKASLKVANIDKEMDMLRKIFIDAIQDTVSSAAKPIRMLLFSSFGQLSEFLGSKVTNDFLLSHLIAGANNRDFEINLACLSSIQKIGIKVGKQSIAQFVLIVFITQFLNHSEEIVVLEFIRTLNNLISLRLISKASILDDVDPKNGNNHNILKKTIPFLLHPNSQIREAAVNFIAILSDEKTQIFTKAEVYCIMRPLIKPYLRNQEAATQYLLSKQPTSELLKQLREPLSRNTYESMVKTEYKKFEHQQQLKPTDSDKYAIKQLQTTIKSTQEKYLRDAQLNSIQRPQSRQHVQTYHEYRLVKANLLETLINSMSDEQFQAKILAKPDDWKDLEKRNTDDYFEDGFTPVQRIYEKDVDNKNYGINSMTNQNRSQIQEIDYIMQSLSFLPDNDKSFSSKMMTKLANQALPKYHFLQIEQLGQTIAQPTQIPQFFNHNSKLAQVQINPTSRLQDEISLGRRIDQIDKFRPEGRLITTFHEHKHPVNKIAVADDQSMFLTASREDGTVLVWSADDVTDVTSHSIQRIVSQNKINDLCMMQGSQYFAIAKENSQVDIYEMGRLSSQASARSSTASTKSVSNPNYKLPNHSAIVKTLEHKDEGEIINCLNTLLPVSHQDLLVYSTQKGSLFMHDMRCKRSALEQRTAFEQQRGMLTCMNYGQDQYQILCGTIGGFVMMYDIRYNIVSTEYQHSERYPINSISCFKPKPVDKHSKLPPMALIAAGGPVYELSMLNLETGDVQSHISVNDDQQQRDNISAGVTIPTFRRKSLIRDAYNWPEKNENNNSLFNRYLMQTRCLVSSTQLKLTQNQDNEFFKAFKDRYRLIKQANESENACRKVLIPRKNTNLVHGTVTADYAITGGNDMKLRYWNLQNLAENSYYINTPNNEECRYIDEMTGGVKYIREQICKEKSFPQLTSNILNIQQGIRQGKTIPNTNIELKSDSIYYSILQNMIVQKQSGDTQPLKSINQTKNQLLKSSQSEIKSGAASQFQLELGQDKVIVNNFNGLSEWQHLNGLSMNQKNQQDTGYDRWTSQQKSSSKKDKNPAVANPYRNQGQMEQEEDNDLVYRDSHNVAHSDAITDLAILEMKNESQPLLISTSRDGTVKVWR